MGSSQAAGYVTRERTLTTWLDELAFVPVDDRADAPVDEWSGDRGCGVQYFSQQAVGRLLGPAGIDVDGRRALPERLVHLQELMAAGDPRAAAVYATIGTYLGYALLDYRELYDVEHLLLLGRVMTGAGGDVIIERARAVLAAEDPAAAEALTIHVPSERDKRHGQAVAAASAAGAGLSRRAGRGRQSGGAPRPGRRATTWRAAAGAPRRRAAARHARRAPRSGRPPGRHLDTSRWIPSTEFARAGPKSRGRGDFRARRAAGSIRSGQPPRLGPTRLSPGAAVPRGPREAA